MLKLHESILVANPAEFLKKESGIFDVTSPTGDKFRVVCRPGRRLRILNQVHLPVTGKADIVWRIEKIGQAPVRKKKRG